MNNKGFAISTMLYGLLIMASATIFSMATLTMFTQKSQNDFVDDVEEELMTFHNNGVCN